ncbi:NAD(P)H-dependent flavin oxidoreductase [Pseudooceanicola atlanticus]|uniref:NAD(P)H-dependent flavin oxidoreductase n=1 Tax=Pseudooceanicola atlanticus TaxID=1461694 RepID=UPI0005C1F093|nr:nitronate monooxygenase [Pseudooceanicola atlanticus]
MPTPVLKTRLTEMYEVPHPIIVGGMMWMSKAPFVAACARAGAMAFLTGKSYEDSAAFTKGLEQCIELAEGHPFGVNFSISRFRPNHIVEEGVEIALDRGIRHFETAGSHPGELIGRIQARGGTVMHKSTQLRHAVKAARDGVDALVLVGMEAGGHPGINPHPSHILLSNLLKEVDIPVALGGGIGTGRQVLGALAQGADAAVLATRFLVAKEIEIHPNYTERMTQAGMDDTIAVLQSIKDTWRVLRNETAKEVARLELAMTGQPVTHSDFGELVKGNYAREHAYRTGEMDKGLMSCSAAIAHADAGLGAGEIVDQLMQEARQALEALQEKVL